jgi:hypothetical protein
MLRIRCSNVNFILLHQNFTPSFYLPVAKNYRHIHPSRPATHIQAYSSLVGQDFPGVHLFAKDIEYFKLQVIKQAGILKFQKDFSGVCGVGAGLYRDGL